MSDEMGYKQETPSLDDALESCLPKLDLIRDSPAGKLLRNFLEVMYQASEDAQEMYEKTLNELRAHAEDVVVEVVRAEGGSDPNDYPFRWALVHAAAELKHPSALPFLKSLVQTPIPPERSKNPHSFSTVAEETILRTTAVEGIEYLAAADNAQAQRALLEFLKEPSLSIRRAAVQAVLATTKQPDEEKIREQVASLLPKDQQFLLDVKRVDVREVPQIEDPQRHLTEAAREAAVEPPPKISGEPEKDAPKAYGGKKP